MPPPALLPDPEPDRQRAFDLESIKRKQRSHSFFRSLNERQQDQFLYWLEEIDDIGAVQHASRPRRLDTPTLIANTPTPSYG